LFSTTSIIIQHRYSLTEEGECIFVKAFAELAEESNGIILESEHRVQDQLSIYFPISNEE